MTWTQKIEQIADDHATEVRRIRYRIEEIDDEARDANARLGILEPEPIEDVAVEPSAASARPNI
ncbi:hypothetical protein [Nocardia transvalensis]|uniref:hypothetical protein n=1 Tax=Nocardia transvalensis TaxID=37333 RepID=UPI00189542C9|nr:hypothetical protein [Nocardia transvalensis]MBF6327484.1 hypothetical protein [Nocardia transvalensis]